MTSNQLVYQAKIHWILFIWPLLLLALAAYLGTSYDALYQPSLLVALIALLWLLIIWMNYQFSSLTIKKKQLILRTGLLVRQTLDIPMDKIESIDIRQPLLGTLLSYGSISITGTGGTKQIINYLRRPLTCRRYIEQMLHE